MNRRHIRSSVGRPGTRLPALTTILLLLSLRLSAQSTATLSGTVTGPPRLLSPIPPRSLHQHRHFPGVAHRDQRQRAISGFLTCRSAPMRFPVVDHRAGKPTGGSLALSRCAMPDASVLVQSTATLSGTVTDPSGAFVTDAAVVCTNTDTHQASRTVTNASGLFRIPDVPVGLCEISVSHPGLAQLVRDGRGVANRADRRPPAWMPYRGTGKAVAARCTRITSFRPPRPMFKPPSTSGR